MADRLLSVPELADYLGISQKSVYALRYRGEGPRAVKIGKQLRFAPADVDAWLAQRAAEDAGRRAS